MSFEILFSGLGLLILGLRLKPWKKIESEKLVSKGFPSVSIIVPCRNEELRLPKTLSTLTRLQYPNLEIIVVNDQSTDRTVEVASEYPVKIVEALPKPESWSGKNWACWTGAQESSGEVLLFTDADTFHESQSVDKALLFMQQQQADMLSAPPFHQCHYFFEKCLGLFHLFPLIATAFMNSPQVNRLYAIGQYILVKRSSYFKIGGHEAIASSLVDDIDFASLCLKRQLRYKVYPGADLYKVQMFEGFQEFSKGWIRLIRLGLKRSSLASVLEMVLVMHLFLSVFWQPSFLNLLIFACGVLLLSWALPKYSHAYRASALLAPVSVVLWSGYSIVAVFESVFHQKIMWRGRAYKAGEA